MELLQLRTLAMDNVQQDSLDGIYLPPPDLVISRKLRFSDHKGQ